MASKNNKSANESDVEENVEDSNLVELGLDEGSYETQAEILAHIVEEEWKQLQSSLENMHYNVLKSQCDILQQVFL